MGVLVVSRMWVRRFARPSASIQRDNPRDEGRQLGVGETELVLVRLGDLHKVLRPPPELVSSQGYVIHILFLHKNLFSQKTY
jgi:hypothetical protein